MLYYRKVQEGGEENPFWCGAHFDHGLFTVLIPAYYFVDGKLIAEPLEAGLFVKAHQDGMFKKVVSDDPDIMMFQVAEFGQLMMDDRIRATEHRVHKAKEDVERYTTAFFSMRRKISSSIPTLNYVKMRGMAESWESLVLSISGNKPLFIVI